MTDPAPPAPATESTPLLVGGTSAGEPLPTWRETLSFIAGYLVPPRHDVRRILLIALAIAATLVNGAVGFAPALLLKSIVDAIVDSARRPVADAVFPWKLLLLRFAASAACLALGALQRNAHELVNMDLGKRVNVAVFAHLHALELAFHMEMSAGEVLKLMSLGTAAVVTISSTAVFEIAPVFWELALVVGIFWSIGVPAVALCIGVAVMLYLGYAAAITDLRKRTFRESRDAATALSSCQVETLTNAATVMSWGRSDTEVDRFSKLAGAVQAARQSQTVTLSALNFGERMIRSTGMVAALLVAAHATLTSSRMTPGAFYLVYQLVGRLFYPFILLSYQYQTVTRALTELEKLVVVWRRVPDIQDAEDAVELEATGGDVRFENVSFRYKRDAEGSPSGGGVSNLSFHVPRGRTVALVGSSGSGKTTSMRLLLRMVECQSGRILVDGRDVRTIKQESLRNAIGIVSQHTVLFNDTLLYNIRYGRPEATDAEVMEAVRAAALEEFVGEQPKGLLTVVGERGIKLSGGQLSRCGIARCVVKRPSIILLDEATAAMDSVTEQAVQTGMAGLCRDRTTLIVAHRLATITHADEILVLDGGEIRERGTHAELVGQRGIYANLWSIQTGGAGQELGAEASAERKALEPLSGDEA
jgi:ATP-binding cassette, subfamily B, heavy metal transporter